MSRTLLFSFFLLWLTSCKQNPAPPDTGNTAPTYKTIGDIERYDEALNDIISPDAKVEVIAEGFDWSEGPLWLDDLGLLLFSDVPKNTVYQWTPAKGHEVYLMPSGYTDTLKRSGETGSNGLTLAPDGKLVLCQHGNRQIAKMTAPLSAPTAKFESLANRYQGKRFNSPNDIVFASNGDFYFTDPPYGLEKQMDDPTKETPWQGVYKVKSNGEVILLVDSLTRPNGVALFPGERRLIVANSDHGKPNWYVYDLEGDKATNGKIFFSAAGYDKTWNGLPDGLKIDKNGNVFATGPGGVYIFNPDGKKLGLVRVDGPTSNCSLTPDGKTLYITNDGFILRMIMRK